MTDEKQRKKYIIKNGKSWQPNIWGNSPTSMYLTCRTTVRCQSWFSTPLHILLLLLTRSSSSIFRTDLTIMVFWRVEFKAQCYLQLSILFLQSVLSSHYAFSTLNSACSQTLKLLHVLTTKPILHTATRQHKKSGLDAWGGRKMHQNTEGNVKLLERSRVKFYSDFYLFFNIRLHLNQRLTTMF